MFGWFSEARVLASRWKRANPVGITGKRPRQDLDRDITIQLRVQRPVELPHPAHADLGGDLIRTEAGAGLQGHRLPRD